MKRIASIVLTMIVAVIIFFGVDAVNANASTVISKTGNDGITWTLDSDGTLTLLGSGAMDDIESGYATGNGFYPITWTEEDFYENMKWHYNCKSSIKKIVIEPGVTRIGQYAFYGCDNVTSISIPEGVVIGACAFASCPKLTTVSIPDGVKFRGLDWTINGLCYAFKDCTGLKKLTIGNDVDLSSKAAFLDCTSLSDLTIGKGSIISSTVFKNDSAITTLTIDTGTDWMYDAFLWCPNISTVNITGTGSFECRAYEEDGYSPWTNSTTVSKVTVAEGVTGLGQGLFNNQQNITEVSLPSTLTTIERLCFYNNTSLQSITIPRSVTRIDEDAFKNVDATFYVYKNSYADSFFTDLGKTVSYIVVDPSAIVDSGDYWTLYESGLLELTDMENYEYEYYDEGYGDFERWSSSPWYTYSGQITSVDIKSGVSFLGTGAFVGCKKLKSVTIPNSVTSIGNGAFAGCTGLTSVTIPDSVKSIGNQAFMSCSGLTRVTIPEGVTSIGGYAFSYCKRLTSITIPKGVTSIGDYAFSRCSKLTSITIPDGVTSIGESMFDCCGSLTKINIPNGVTIIGERAFAICKSLTSIRIPNSVTRIKDQAFADCVSLKSITIPGSVKSIGYEAFGSCYALKSVKILDGVKSIDGEAFAYSGITSVTIPASVTSIKGSSFEECYSAVFIVKKGSYAHTFVKNKGLKYDLTSGHQWKHIVKKAGLLKNGSKYDQCTTCKKKKNVKKLTGYATYYVKGFKVSAAKAAFTAKWKKQSSKNRKKFNGYQIRYSTKSSMKGAKYATASKKSSSKKITKLKKKTKYYVQVRTYTISKKVKYYSKWSTKKAVRTK